MPTRIGCTGTSDLPNSLQLLTYKRAEFVTCPACRHGATTVLAKQREAPWRQAVATTGLLLASPLTLGTSLFMLPQAFAPVHASHYCRRCGLRIAVATASPGEGRFAIPMDLDDDRFVPAPDGWRPELARLPGGARVARSPLGLPPKISEAELQAYTGRFTAMRACRRLRLLRDDESPASVIQCVLEDARCDREPGQPWSSSSSSSSPSPRPDGKTAKLYRIRTQGIELLGSSDAGEAWIVVGMQPPPEEEPPPAYDEKSTDTGKEAPQVDEKCPRPETETHSGSARPLLEACRICLYPEGRRKFSSVTFIPSTSHDRRAGNSRPDGQGTIRLNAVRARHRTQFASTRVVWRWESSEGGLLWVVRRFQDADMEALQHTLCLVDDYDRLLAVAENWQGLCSQTSAADRAVLALYADISAGLLGQVLGSLCTLAVQSRRLQAEFEKEARDETRRGY